MKRDLINLVIGLIIGAILTFIGSQIQFNQYKDYEKERERKTFVVSTIKFLDKRLHRSSAIRYASNSSVFDDRWEDYINEVVYPWNENLFLMDNAIAASYNNEVHSDFEDICEQFRNLHKSLRGIRLKQKAESKSSKNDLSNYENEAESIIQDLTEKIELLKAQLID